MTHTMIQHSKTVSTSFLFQVVNSSLIAKEWPAARQLMDELATRKDNTDKLCGIDSYVGVTEMVPEYKKLLQERIDLINSRAL